MPDLPLSQADSLDVVSKMKSKIESIPWKRYLSPEKIIQGVLLGTQKQINSWLVKLRNKSMEKPRPSFDAYWQELKKLPRVSFKLNIKKSKEKPARVNIESSKDSKAK